MPNLKAKYIIDENGDRVAPITYIDAVRDSNGDSLSDLMVPEKLGSGIGTCSTSSGTALTVSLTGYELVQNGFVAVSFEHDVPANATLNINSKGAKPIYYKGAAIEADTIKADDTVMFCYDGTNYVVTSLGGGGGTIVWPEFVTIQLTQNGGSDSVLIGATIVVTDDNTHETIYSGTWQGSDIAVVIDAGVEYTVTVGDIIDYVSPIPKSYTAESGLSKFIILNYQNVIINLGLPSGRKWAMGNIVPNGNGGYKIGRETDSGAYISFGNIVPHFSSNGSSLDDGYTETYANTNGATINIGGGSTKSNAYAADSGYDAARSLLGGPWRMPTAVEYQELYDNCTSAWVIKDGVYGREFTSKVFTGVKIFFPAAGYAGGNGIINSYGSYGMYTTSSLYSNGYDWCLAFNSSSVTPQAYTGRGTIYTVRAVQ